MVEYYVKLSASSVKNADQIQDSLQTAKLLMLNENYYILSSLSLFC